MGARLEWSRFGQMDEQERSRFLIDQAWRAWSTVESVEPGDDQLVADRVEHYLRLASQVSEGEASRLPDLLRLFDDPGMRDDLSALHEDLRGHHTATAALDLAAYACAYVARLAGERNNIGGLPDPVLEALPDIHDYYRRRARQLGL